MIIRKVGVTDFGNYSCMAENSLGRERGYIQITGVQEGCAYVFPNPILVKS